MQIPNGAIEVVVTGVVGFIFKVVFGLIQKNEQKSDEADRRLEEEIKETRKEMRALDERHRQNENSLFEKAAKAQSDVSYMKGQSDSKA